MEFVLISLVSFVMYPSINKYIYSKLNDKNDIEKITEEGLYHVTSEEAVKSIIDSGFFKPSNIITSYGNRKVFFFAGIPKFKEAMLNGIKDIEEQKLIAVKIKPTKEQLQGFKVRKYDDGAIAHIGKLYIEQIDTSIAYLILDINEKGELYFKETTKEEYYNHKPSKIVEQEINIKNFISAYKYQYKLSLYGSIN
ncbi:MAG TPA: hypothetical protein GX747_00355, partial [Tenericutes bacterium]|nr:hypothetical protein [Mycoplasmatota bacterium]